MSSVYIIWSGKHSHTAVAPHSAHCYVRENHTVYIWKNHWLMAIVTGYSALFALLNTMTYLSA